VIFCADNGGRRLWKLDFSGAVVKRIPMPKGHRARYGAIDFYHNLWVTDTDKHCVLKFDRNLELLDIFGSRGSGDNQFIEPRGITIWKRYGQTFIAEEKGAQYYWMGTECRSSGVKYRENGGCRVSVDVTEHSYVSVYHTTGSDTTYCIRRKMVYPGGRHFDLPACGKTPFTRGQKLTLRIEPTYSSYTYNHWNRPAVVGD
jgi:hypothetical protein